MNNFSSRKPSQSSPAMGHHVKSSKSVRRVSQATSTPQQIPFATELKNLEMGSLITITGTILKRCQRFSINFLCGDGPHADIAFHFNPRTEKRYVVRNCRLNGYWGDEETSGVSKFPFAKGRKFTVDVFVSDAEYMVSVDGTHWCSFTHRRPYAAVTNLDVRGLVEVHSFATKTINSYPEYQPNFTPVKRGDATLQKHEMPYLGKLADPFETGWEIDIVGRPKLLPQNFYINLQDGPQMWPHPNVPLHLNPRFCTMNGIDVFVANAWWHGTWFPEERAPFCPFLAGNEFELHIRRDADAFTIWSGEKIISEFKFKCPVDCIKYISVVGDVDVSNVSMSQRNRTYVVQTPTKSGK